jgi:hypothetical protein
LNGLVSFVSQMGVVGWMHTKMDQKWSMKKFIVFLSRCFGNVKLSIWKYETSGMLKL